LRLPVDGALNGLAWDGEKLWALDKQQKRICVIEKAAPGEHGLDSRSELR